MLFNSLEFLCLFLPLTWIFWRLTVVRSENLALWILLIASLTYYAVWEPKNLLVLAPLGFLTYVLGKIIERQHSKPALIAAIVVNLGALIWFKYSAFISENLHAVFGSVPLLSAGMALPLGISFFVFQKIALSVDLYKKRAVIDRVDRFALFVLFFPQLIAGPIVHYRQLAPQLNQRSMLHAADLPKGLFIFAAGLCMKTMIADALSSNVGAVFDHVDKVDMLSAWLGTLAYTVQLYFDFAGYGAMAVGLALMFGIHLPWNFNSPYKALSIVEFWKRWHITLSEFLRDYLYIPLGGNRHGTMRRYINLMTTMLLGGLWHGAGWPFVFWGGLHGLYICICHAYQKSGIKLPPLFSHGLTLVAVMFAWIFFRAPDLHSALVIIKRMLVPQPEVTWAQMLAGLPSTRVLLTLALAWVVALFAPNVKELSQSFNWERPRLAVAGAAVLLIIGVLSQLYTGDVYEFIYFRF